MRRVPYSIAVFVTLLAIAAASFFVAHQAHALTVTQIFNGGTGTSTAPAYGEVLVGGKSGEYELVSTSTFGGGGSSSALLDHLGELLAHSTDYVWLRGGQQSLFHCGARACRLHHQPCSDYERRQYHHALASIPAVFATHEHPDHPDVAFATHK